MLDPLAERYTTPEMCDIWGLTTTIRTEHKLWLDIAQAQAKLGLDITEQDLAAYENTAHQYRTNPEYRHRYHQMLAQQERTLGHQTMARLRTFDTHSGNLGKLHLGLTSSDITENTQQAQILRATALVALQAQNLVLQLREMGDRLANTTICGRTHNMPAQPTTLGHRFARTANELAHAIHVTSMATSWYPRRGLRGAVGTNADLLQLLGGDTRKLDILQQIVVGDTTALGVCGQNYPRSWDLPLIAATLGLCAAPSSLATTIRLMSGNRLAAETRTPGQVGSSAMPHKTTPSLSERIHGLQVIARGYASMLEATCGDSWNEGDVSDSCIRRVALPGLFMAVNGLLNTTQQLLDRVTFDFARIAQELDQNRSQLATGQLLAAAVQHGVPREQAHTELLNIYSGLNGRTLMTHHVVNSPTLGIDETQALQILGADNTGTADQEATNG